MNLADEILEVATKARQASRAMVRATAQTKNLFLKILAERIPKNIPAILEANHEDIAAASADGLDTPRIERLSLTEKSCHELAQACLKVAEFPDPIGATEEQWQRPNGLLVGKMRIPLGVICMIYEARPGVTIDAAILSLKAGNAIILRGGKEARNTNCVLARILGESLAEAQLPAEAAQLIQTQDRSAVTILCKMDNLIDLIIPRGGESLVRKVAEEATMPVLMHYKGVCHCYIDQGANLEQALEIVENSKSQRPGVCNALECLLVHRDEATRFLPRLAQRLSRYPVEFRADPASLPLLGPHAIPLTDADLGREFMSQILVVLIVNNMDQALDHIARYGSRHTDIICSSDYYRSMRFLREVDASMVAVNASTRFNDGGQLGLGAEIGISTTKFHSYGPMGVKELTTTKFVVLGNGQIRN